MPTTPSGEADKWAGLLLTEALSGLYRYAQKEMRGELTPQKLEELQRQRGQKPGSFKVTLSKARYFLKESRTELVKIMKNGFGGLVKEDYDYLEAAVRVDKALAGVEAGICQILPNFSRGEAERWPGPIGYRVALNHFVAVSLRVHSMFPKVAYDDVTSCVGEVVLTPILAHNLTFLLRSDPVVFRVIAGDGKARDADISSKSLLKWYAEKTGADTKDEDYHVPSSMSAMEKEAFLRWRLLFDAFVHFHPSKGEARKQFGLMRDLVTEHVENPATSRLWSSLADLASGDLSADEMLVAKVIQHRSGLFEKTDQAPLVHCARARFGLLRFAYKMEAEANRLKTNPESAMAEAEVAIRSQEEHRYSEHAIIEDVQKIFGWSYHLSRRILIGRKVEGTPGYKFRISSGTDQASALLKTEWKAYGLLDRALLSLSRPRALQPNSVARGYGLLALRYWAGMRSNPRFIIDAKGFAGTAYIEEAISRLKEDYARDIPKAIVWMLIARNALHQAHLHRHQRPKHLVQLDQALSHYARTLDAILDSKIKFEPDPSIKNIEGTMDGEIAAWCVPEMVAALTMKEKATEDRKQRAHISRYRKALITAGEVQFGIYFDLESEMERINDGLRIRCDIRS